MRRVPAPFVMGFLACLGLACGPSIRMLHQSDGYFERCVSADFDARVPVSAKRACWAQWLEHYTIGQSAERIRYARDRVSAIESGVVAAPMPGVSPSSNGIRAISRAVVAPEAAAQGVTDASTATTSVLATETITAAADAGTLSSTPDAGVPSAAVAPPPPMRRTPPGGGNSACNRVCNPRWNACIKVCEDESSACIRTCELEYRTCSNGCF